MARLYGGQPITRVPQGRHQRPRDRRRARPSTRRPPGPRPPGGTGAPSRAAAARSCGCASTGPSRWRRTRPPRADGRTATSGAEAWAGAAFAETVERREREADEFYGALAGGRLDEERMRILRQASAGLVWSKQFYPYRVGQWLDGDPAQPAPPRRSCHRDATPGGATSTPSTSSRCPTPGSTRGSRPGTWPSTRSPGPTSIPRSPSTSSS